MTVRIQALDQTLGRGTTRHVRAVLRIARDLIGHGYEVFFPLGPSVATLAQVIEGSLAVASAVGVSSAKQDGDAFVIEVGSGDYVFSYPTALVSVKPSRR